MSKNKLQLDDLKVQSFVTKLDSEKEETVKGGFFPSFGPTFCGGARLCDDSFFARCTGYHCPKVDAAGDAVLANSGG